MKNDKKNFIFENSLYAGETFFPCRCDIFPFFEFLLLCKSSTAPVFSYNQIYKQPENLYVNYRECFGNTLSSQRLRCFNNAILHLNEIIKDAIVTQNLRPSFSNEGTLSVRARRKIMEKVDWCPR